MARSRRRRSEPPRRKAEWPAYAALFVAFLLVAGIVYRGALSGPFVSDDVPYITMNPYVQQLDAANLIAILDPNGPVVPLAANWSPVHLLLHALEWQLFGRDVRGYHVVNVVLHALGSVLLVALLRRSTMPFPLAVFGGAFFLLHPANVEAVAWISQLKTTAAFVLVLGALLLHPHRPLAATLAFALALLTKPLAAFALPVAALRDWAREGRVRGGWLALWALAFAGVAVAEIAAFRDFGIETKPLHPDPWVWGRTIVALVARYLVMAATSWGVSTFHELPRALGWLDPWWLAGLVVLVVLGGRTVVALRARREEAAWWIWAIVSFGPVSQVFPFDFAMADRYLYFILPGLLGGTLLWGSEVFERSRLAARLPAGASLVALGLVAALALGFAVRSSARADLWRSAALLGLDAARHYPDGRQAHMNAARNAASAGQLDRAAIELRAAIERGHDYLIALHNDPLFASARRHPAVDEVFRELASTWIARIRALQQPNQAELNLLAVAHEVRGEYEEAVRALERALAVGGFEDELVRARLAAVRTRALQARKRPADDRENGPDAGVR